MTIGHQSRVSMENFELIKPANLILDDIDINIVSPDVFEPQENQIILKMEGPINKDVFKTP